MFVEFTTTYAIRVQHYVIKFVSDLWQVSGFLHQLNWLPRYNWNIVESGVNTIKQ
jgi:hypothetical protein